MSDTQEGSSEDASKKSFLRFQNTWKPGEKFPVYYVPSVEGMVVTTRWMESVLMVVFLSPPFKKAEGTWSDAALMYKAASSLVRKPLPSYEFPFPDDPRIVEEVKKANGNLDMLKELVKFLNKQSLSAQSSQEPHKSQALPRTAWDPDELDETSPDQVHSDRLSLHLLLSQQDENDQVGQPPISENLITKLVEEISQRLTLQNNPPKDKTNKRIKTSQKKQLSSSSSSSSASSSSASEASSSSKDEKVGNLENEDGKGWFYCPFSTEDVRRTGNPRKQMKGRIEERRYIRRALHDIYSEHHTLRSFVETVRSESLSSSSKPHTTDLCWLSHHANYLDLLLLHAVDGPWKPWNELVVDQLAKAFLELLVRSSANRAYPEILDEHVRKWMKRKRVGLSARFGSIPGFLAEAKITDSGVHPKGGWEARNNNKNTSFSASTVRPKSQSSGNDKKN